VDRLEKELEKLRVELSNLKNDHAIEVSGLTTQLDKLQLNQMQCAGKLKKAKDDAKAKIAKMSERNTKAILALTEKMTKMAEREETEWKHKIESLENKLEEQEKVDADSEGRHQLKVETEDAAAAAAKVFEESPHMSVVEGPSVTRVLSDAREKWEELDSDGSGKLASEELLKLYQWLVDVLASPGTPVAQVETEARSLLKATAGKRMGNGMTWDQFRVMYSSIMEKRINREIELGGASVDRSEARKIFDEIDRDKSGLIGGLSHAGTPNPNPNPNLDRRALSRGN